jgi:hypothetical protein
MAYMSQEKKAKIAPKIKAILAKYKVKGSLAVRNHMTLCLNLKSGSIDFIANSNKVCGNSHYQVARGFKPSTSGYDQVNPYHFKDHYDGKALAFMQEVFAAMKGADWYDNSDAQTDYFDTAYYVDVNIGSWNKNYILTA